MTQFIQTPYKDTTSKYYLKFKGLLQGQPVGKWKRITKTLFCYKNANGFYHTCELKKQGATFYIEDYVLSANFEQNLAHTYYFNKQENLIEFLKNKIGE